MQEATAIVDAKSWPPLLDTDDLAKRKLSSIYQAPSPDVIAYLDFSVSTTGVLAGVKVSEVAWAKVIDQKVFEC